MTLLIDSSNREKVVLQILKAKHEFASENLSEKLVPEIEKFLKKQKIKFKDLTKVEVKTDFGFSKTRTVVATANGLIFSLGLKQKLIQPSYDKAPNITLSKKSL